MSTYCGEKLRVLSETARLMREVPSTDGALRISLFYYRAGGAEGSMSVWEILLIGVALSMDAFAVGMTDGMVEPKMAFGKAFTIALSFAVFQFAMPILGYLCGSVFSMIVEKIAPWLSFCLLAFIGGKMILDFTFEKKDRHALRSHRPLGTGKMLVQAVATSLDALAVGVTLLAAETSSGLPFGIVYCTMCIGAITFSISLAAVLIGKRAGNRLADEAELFGGLILAIIGLKILIEGLV